jgi:hypothetical protein
MGVEEYAAHRVPHLARAPDVAAVRARHLIDQMATAFDAQMGRPRSTFRPPKQPGLALALARGGQVELRECNEQLAGGHPEGALRCADLAECGDRQQPARCQAPDDRPVEAAVPELVAEDDIDGWPGRQAVVEIDDVEPAAIGDPAAPGQIPRLADGHWRDVDAPDVQASAGKPHGTEPLPTGEIERVPCGREQVLVRCEHARRADRTDRRRSPARMRLVPADAVLLGHPRHPTKWTGHRAIRP